MLDWREVAVECCLPVRLDDPGILTYARRRLRCAEIHNASYGDLCIVSYLYKSASSVLSVVLNIYGTFCVAEQVPPTCQTFPRLEAEELSYTST